MVLVVRPIRGTRIEKKRYDSLSQRTTIPSSPFGEKDDDDRATSSASYWPRGYRSRERGWGVDARNRLVERRACGAHGEQLAEPDFSRGLCPTLFRIIG